METTKHKDPVCGMQIEATDAAGQSDYEGRTVYFCSSGCKEQFDADPAMYNTQEVESGGKVMNESKKTGLIVGLIAVVVLFLLFGFGAMSGSFADGGMMGGGQMMGDGSFGRGGYGWMWIPTVLTLATGIFLGWLLFAKKA